MIELRDISVSANDDFSRVLSQAAKLLRIKETDIETVKILRRSVDARKKNDVRLIYTLSLTVKGKEEKILRFAHCPKASVYQPCIYEPPKAKIEPKNRPVVVGFGPAGMFCALVLSMAGLRPIVLERGLDAVTRRKKVEEFWRSGILDPECNVQFGEGGAGTFSDGKLNSGIKNERIGWVLEQFAEAGAPGEILFDAKPHIGTDKLFTVVQNLREKIVSLGGEVRFGCKLTKIEQKNSAVCAVYYEQDGQEISLACDKIVLAIGHSARDTFQMLVDSQIPMEPKPFSMGVRIEHPQKAINESQYGAFADCERLGAADYKLHVQLPDGNSAYTFCMCPGGQVVAAASETGRVVTNGMSNAARSGKNANAALLVTLHPEDFPYPGVLGGVKWQQELEQAAFVSGGSNYRAPAQLVGDFLKKQPSTALGSVEPTYRPGVTLCDLHEVLPEKLTSVLEQAIPALDRYLHGYAREDAVMTAPETRSSSPVRILRNENRQSVLRGLFPCGEGAGYAGGIMSAAVDGIQTAEAVIAENIKIKK